MSLNFLISMHECGATSSTCTWRCLFRVHPISGPSITSRIDLLLFNILTLPSSHDSAFPPNYSILLYSHPSTLLSLVYRLLLAYLFFFVQPRSGKWFSKHESREHIEIHRESSLTISIPVRANNNAAATRFSTRSDTKRQT